MGKPRKYDYKKVVDLYRDLQSTFLVADEIRGSQVHVARILRSMGVKMRLRGQAVRRKKTQLPDDVILQRYLAGEDCRQIANALGLTGKKSSEAIRKRLIRLGISRRNRGAFHGKRNHFYKHGQTGDTMHYYRRQSYEIAAICLGLPVPQQWVIHHLDENPSNNSPENLVLFPTQNHHARFHSKLTTRLRLNHEVSSIQLALEIGGQVLQRPESLSEWKPDIVRPDLSKTRLKPGFGPKLSKRSAP